MRSLALLILVAGCGGAAPAPAASPQPVPTSTACPSGQILVESCVVGGMPNEDGTANTSCGKACRTTPPQPGGSQTCERLAPDRYRCTGYAP